MLMHDVDRLTNTPVLDMDAVTPTPQYSSQYWFFIRSYQEMEAVALLVLHANMITCSSSS